MSFLTIAIPTYNRSYSLNLLLGSICKQLEGLDSSEVELLILDNCSPDNTEEIVRARINGISNVKYIRHNHNIGADNNFVTAFYQAAGDYVWIIGDDELLFDGSIRFVLNLCATEYFGAAYVASIPVALSGIENFTGASIPREVQTLSFDPWGFAQVANYRLTFLSGSVVNKRNILEKRPLFFDNVQNFKGTNLVHLTWIFAAILASDKSIFVRTPLFASTIANSGGYNPVLVFIINLGSIFESFFTEIQAGSKSFINLIVLIGWFPRVSYDSRFNSKYDASLMFVPDDFPEDIKTTLAWKLLFLVLKAPRPIAFISMLTLKVWHRVYQGRLYAKGQRLLCQ